MTPEEREHMLKLVAQIEVEKDHHKFTQLIEELNALLDDKKHRLAHKPSLPPDTKS